MGCCFGKNEKKGLLIAVCAVIGGKMQGCCPNKQEKGEKYGNSERKRKVYALDADGGAWKSGRALREERIQNTLGVH